MNNRKKKDKHTFIDDVLHFVGWIFILIFAISVVSFASTNPQVATLLNPNNWTELVAILAICLGGWLFISWLNREV